jgi:hypothetical protein
MVQPANSFKELNLNKPNTFDRDREKFRKFLQDVEVYLDVNHEVYNTDLRKIAFVLSFMTARVAATWKAQFINKANTQPAPANPNNKLGTYTTFRKHLINGFSMFDSVRDALNKLWALRMKKNDSIDKHIAKFKMLVVESKSTQQIP